MSTSLEMPYSFLCVNGYINRTAMINYMRGNSFAHMYHAMQYIFTWMEDNGYTKNELADVYTLLEELTARDNFDYVMDELFINVGYCDLCDRKTYKCKCDQTSRGKLISRSTTPNQLIKNSK